MVESALADAATLPVGAERVLAGLWRAARQGHLPHALLFTGPAGVGKFRAAKTLALGLVCEEGPPEGERGPCGACAACKRFLSGNHLDVFVVDAAAEGEETLAIGRFVPRDPKKGPTVEEFLRLRAADGGWRIVLVREIERATANAQNSMLKMLEEPGERVLWVLETSRLEALLPTILSRCVPVHFDPLDDGRVAEVLAALGRADAVEPYARWSRGAPGAALALEARGGAELRSALAGMLRGELDPLEAVGALWAVEGEFEGKSPKAAERDRARCVFGLLFALLADAQRAAAGVPADDLAHGDLELGGALARLDLREAVHGLAELALDVERNVDPRAVLERAALSLAPRTTTGRTR